MSKWSEFIYSFSTTTQPFIEQLIDDSSLSIADFEALKALSESQLKSKLEGASIANPSFIKAFATFFYNGHAGMIPVSNYTLGINGECDERWETYINGYEELWQEVVRSFKSDIAPILLSDFGQYANLFNPELLPLISEINIDPQLGYPAFTTFKADALPAIQAKLQALDVMSSFISQLATLMDAKAAVASDWHTFENGSFPGDESLTLLLTTLQLDMTAAGTTFNDFSTFDSGEMATALVTDAPNFLNELATYLVYFRDCTWNHFISASISELETHIDGFTASSESFVSFTELVLPQAQNVQVSPSGEYIVKGIIIDLAGAPIVGKKVKVFDKNYKDVVQVGSTFTTNFDGEYGIGFNKTDLGDLDKDAPDLEIEVFDTDGSTSLRKAPCVLNATNETEMNLVVGTGTYTGQVEYEIIHRKLSRVIGNADISSDTDCDMLNLAYRFGLSFEYVNLYFNARSYSQNFTDIDPQVLYGLMRGSGFTDFNKMLFQPASSLVSKLERAASSNIVTRSYLDEAPGGTSSSFISIANLLVSNLLSQIPSIVLAHSIESTKPLNVHVSNVEFITSSTLSTAKRTEIVSILMESEQRVKDGTIYWDNLSNDSSLSTAQIEALKFSALLASALLGRRGFAKNLIQTDGLTDLDSILALDTTEWQNKIDAHTPTIPEAINDDSLTAIENRDNYVTTIQEYLESVFPTKYLVARLDEQTTIPKADFQTFFSNNDVFDLGQSNVAEYLEDNTGALNGISDTTAFTADLHRLVRLFRLSPTLNRTTVIEALWEKGIYSASKILLMGQAAFTELMSSHLSEDQIKITFRKASQRASEALHIHANFTSHYTNVLPSVISESFIKIEEGSLPAKYSDLEELLSSGDYCTCSHCQSVFSPAAYLHDILIWLDGINGAGSQSLLDIFLNRRPELDKILLDCGNTNTEIPYIDLIIELLEYEINKNQSSPDWGIYGNETTFLSRQTTGERAELKAFPEHLLPGVYSNVLAKTAYPWKTGGFDLWSTQWDTFLSFLNVSPYLLSKNLEKSDGGFLTAAQQDLKDLHINPLESALIRYDSAAYNTITTKTLGLYTLYGYEDQSALEGDLLDDSIPALVRVDKLLDRTGMELDELKEYLSAHFINPDGALVTFPVNSCSLSSATLELSQTELQKFYQFYRLHQKTGGSITDLDAALKGNALSTESDLTTIAQIRRIANWFKLDIAEVAIWFNQLSLHSYNDKQSDYDKIFLNQLITPNYSDVLPKFISNTLETELNDTISDFNDGIVSTHLKRVLNLSDTDYTTLVAHLGTTKNIASISELYSYVSISRSLNMSIASIILASSLFEFSSFTGVYSFIERLIELKESGFKIEEVDFLLRKNNHFTSNVGIENEDAIATLDIIRSELQTVLGDYLVTDTNDRKKEVESMITRLAEAGIAPWNDSEHVDSFMARLARTVDIHENAAPADWEEAIPIVSANSEAFSNFKISLTTLNFSTAVLDPLESALFTSFQDTPSAANSDPATPNPAYLDPATASEARYAVVSNLLRDKVTELTWSDYAAEGKQIVTQNISSWLSIDENITAYLLENHLSLLVDLIDFEGLVSKTDTITYSSPYNTFIDDLKSYFRLSHWMQKKSLSARNIQVLFNATQSPFDLGLILNGINPYSVDHFDAFSQLNRLVDLNTSFKTSANDLVDILAINNLAEKQDVLIAASGWNDDLVKGLGASQITTAEILKIAETSQILKKGNLSYNQAKSWNKLSIDEQLANSVSLAVKQKVEQQQGNYDKVAELRDNIRRSQRDALLNYLIAFSSTPGFDDSNNVYDYLLADPEMNPCMPSSRIKFASLSAQLFVNRILLNIELSPLNSSDTLVIGKDNVEEWEWRKNYRVWEANRKVFTYPENWMEPDLRDDKTELFKIMEDQLQQVEATDESASDIFINYVEDLDKISKLEIAQMYRDDVNGIIYVFATIPGTTPEYYYRKLVRNSYWTEWQKVDLQIESSQLIPVVWNEQLVLLWPTFEQKGTVPDNPKVNTNSKNQLFARLNWSTLKGDKWSTPNKSTNTVLIDVDFVDTDRVFFSAKFSGKSKSTLSVRCFSMYRRDTKNGSQIKRKQFNSFRFNGGLGSDPVILNDEYFEEKDDKNLSKSSLKRFLYKGKAAKQKFWNDWAYVDQTDVLDMSYNYGRDDKGNVIEVDVNILNDVAQPSWLTIPHQFVNPHSLDLPKRRGTPMFFEDDQRVYFVRQKTEIESINTSSAREISISMSEVMPMSPVAGFEVPSSPESAPANTMVFGQNNSGDGIMPASGPIISLGTDQESISPWGITVTHSDGDVNLVNVPKGNGGFTPTDGPVLTAVEMPYAPSSFTFVNFYHPYTKLMLRQLRRHGVDGLLDPNYKNDTDSKLMYRQSVTNEYFEDTYSPTNFVNEPYPVAAIDFDYGSSYGSYNWEVFFHAPISIATRLMSNQKFEEAKKWLEYIFDPTETDNYDVNESGNTVLNHNTPDRFWKLKPFRELSTQKAEDRLISYIDGTGELRDEQIEAWKENPFSPYAIGRVRMVSFMKKTVMLYLDNLIAWGDYLFARDTMESINEAAMLYVLAARILGKRPRKVNKDGTANSFSEQLLKDGKEGEVIQFENTLAEKLQEENTERAGASLSSINLPDFCIPQNEKMIGYWDITIDRLFKVRNCMNISGIVRKLPLFEPAIDPAILVRAFASGLGVSGALAEVYDSPSPYRYAYLYQKAVEYTNDVKSFGNSILSAIEKRDGEELSVLRSDHEVNLLDRQLELKKKSIEEAELSIESLEINKQITNDRYLFNKNRERRSEGEKEQLTRLQKALFYGKQGQSLSSIAGLLAGIPEFSTGTSGLGPVVEAMAGGRSLSAVVSFGASIMNQMSSTESQQAGMVSIRSGHKRRDEEWDFQTQTAQKELENVDKQIESAQIRLLLAEKEVSLHEQQISQAKEVNAYMKDKYSNKELYNWMLGRLSKLYFEAYNLAYKMAKKAEKAYYYELGLDQGTSSFIQFNNWDNLKKGLLSGEGLHNNLKRMDTAYTENNVREYELTKQFSLAALNADQLIQLRETGTCDFSISELMYDLDHPGHYYRRIKSVSITLPCIAGPFTNISAKLTLLNHRIRTSSSLGDNDYNNVSFKEGTDGVQSIATSTGQNDSGVFELNFNDSRYLPFEYTGAISSWRLELPNTENTSLTELYRQFDYNTISDVILTVRYMAREGGSVLKDAALKNVESNLNKALDYGLSSDTGLMRVVSMKSEFPTELHQFISPNSGQGRSTSFELKSKHFPYMFRNQVTDLECMSIEAIVKLKDGYSYATPSVGLDLTNGNFSSADVALTEDSDLKLYKATFGSTSDSPANTWTLSNDTSTDSWNLKKGTDNAEPIEAIDDIYFVVKYKKGA